MPTTCLTLMCAALLSACQLAASDTTLTSPSPAAATATIDPELGPTYRPVGRNRWLYDEQNVANLAAANGADIDSSAAQVNYAGYGLMFTLEKPEGWSVHETDDALILIERVGPMTGGGELQGMMATVFVPSLKPFTLPDGEDANIAYVVLKEVTRTHSYVGSARTTAPQAFEWGDYGAAYYLMNSGRGAVGIVLAVTSPPRNRLLVINVSAPVSKAGSIRSMLPALLDSLTVNGVEYDSGDLSKLPDPLIFPQRSAAVLQRAQ